MTHGSRAKSASEIQQEPDRLYAAINESLRSPELLASYKKFGFEVMIKQQGDLEAFIASEAQRWPPIVSAAGLKPE